MADGDGERVGGVRRHDQLRTFRQQAAHHHRNLLFVCAPESDDRTLVVTMDRPYPTNLILSSAFAVATTFLLDREELLAHVKDNDYGNAWLKTTSACVGPYRVRTFNANDVIILERNDVWPAADKQLSQADEQRGQAQLDSHAGRGLPAAEAKRLSLGALRLDHAVAAGSQRGSIATTHRPSRS